MTALKPWILRIASFLIGAAGATDQVNACEAKTAVTYLFTCWSTSVPYCFPCLSVGAWNAVLEKTLAITTVIVGRAVLVAFWLHSVVKAEACRACLTKG